MKPSQIVIVAIIGVALGALAGVVWQKFKETQPVIAHVGADAVDHIPAFIYPDLEGRQHSNTDLEGKIVVLNFWATWCPPCMKETPLFVETQDKYRNKGVQFIGIAIDDPEPTQEFADTYGINYPVLMGDVKAIAMSKAMGNRFEGLPYTVITKADGSIYKRFSGLVERKDLETALQDLMKNG